MADLEKVGLGPPKTPNVFPGWMSSPVRKNIFAPCVRLIIWTNVFERPSFFA